MKRVRFFSFLFFVFIISSIYSQNKFEYAPNQLIVKVKDELFNKCKNYTETNNKANKVTLLNLINKEFQNIGIYRIDKLHIMNKFLSKDAERSFVIYFEDKNNLSAFINKLKSIEKVESVTSNYLRSVTSIEPDDKKYSKQWSLQKIKMPQAWEIQKGCSSIKVAVLDIGFRKKEHNDIKNKYDAVRKDLTDIDIDAYLNNAYKKIRGEDYETTDNEPYTKNMHGVHVAGIVGAETNNNKGLASVGWNINVIPVRCGFYIKDQFGDKITFFEDDDVIRAIDWVVANKKARVINMSFGGGMSSNEYGASLNAAVNAGIVLIGAAGNSNDDVIFPASHPSVIAVGSTNTDDVKSSFSCFGENLDLVSPGKDIWVLNKKYGFPRYTEISGTSMSAPLVSATAALILSQNPELTPNQVKQILIESNDKVAGMHGNNWTKYYGYGRLNVFKALQFVPSVKYNHLLENEVITNSRQVLAIQTITTENNCIVKSGANVVFKAGEEITLNPGFEAENGSNFMAYIGNVETNNCIPDCPNINVNGYPNYISDNLCYSISNANYYEISVFNNVGQLVFSDSGDITNNYVCVWNSSSFANGNYEITIFFRNECGKTLEKTYTITKVSKKKYRNNKIKIIPFHFDIMPNPVENIGTIYLNVKQNTNIEIYIQDLTGRKIKTIASFSDIERSDYKIPINFNGMQQGIYFIVAKSSENIQTKKIIHLNK